MSAQVIWHGDARELAPKVQGPIHCIVTDPPYGMDMESGHASTRDRQRWVEAIAHDGDLDTALALFRDVMTPLVPKLADDADVYVFTRWNLQMPWVQVIEEFPELSVENQIIWDKDDLGMGDIYGNWGLSYEVILYAKKGRRLVNPPRRHSIIRMRRVDKEHHIHPTQKPIPLMERLIAASTSPNDLVVDPFVGSGATAAAAKKLGRRCIGMELNPRFVDRARMQLEEGNLFA